jgi:hypothetical protein
MDAGFMDQDREPDAIDRSDPAQEIVRLEARIEKLADGIERCRKIALVSKIGIALGVALLLAILLGIIQFHPVALIASFTMILGGVVLFGSNSSTSKQAMTALKAAEAERTELIGRLDLHLVSDES